MKKWLMHMKFLACESDLDYSVSEEEKASSFASLTQKICEPGETTQITKKDEPQNPLELAEKISEGLFSDPKPKKDANFPATSNSDDKKETKLPNKIEQPTFEIFYFFIAATLKQTPSEFDFEV